MSLPPFLLQADVSGTAFGGTPVWTDISTYALTTGDDGSPMTGTWGRQDFSGDVTSASATFILDNGDGRFTPGRTGLVNNLLIPDLASPGCVSAGVTNIAPTLGSGVTVSIDETQQLPDGPSNSLKLNFPTTFTSGNACTQSIAVACSGTTAYSFAQEIKATNVGWKLQVVWYNSSGTLISSTYGTAVAVGTTGYSTITNVISPGAAATFKIAVTPATNTTGTGTIYVGNITWVTGATVVEELVAPYYPAIRRGLHLRLSTTISSTVAYFFDGYANSIEASFENGVYGICTVNCSDILARYLNDNSSLGFLYEENLIDSPAFLYPLQEAEGSTSFGDVTGNLSPATIANSKYGPGIVDAGQSTGSGLLGSTVVEVTNTTSYAETSTTGQDPGSWINVALPASFPLVSTLQVCVALTTVLPGSVAGLFNVTTSFGSYGLEVDDTGLFQFGVFDNVTGGFATATFRRTSLFDGNAHLYVLQVAADLKTISVFVDGVLAASAAATIAMSSGFLHNATCQLGFLYDATHVTNSLITYKWGANAGYAYFAGWTSVLSTSRITAYFNAGNNGFQGDRTDARITRLLSYRPDTGVNLDTGLGTMGIQDLTSESFGQALLDCGDVEGGVVYADGQGRTNLRSRANLFNPTASLTLDASQVQVDVPTTFRDDTQNVANNVTVTRNGGADSVAFNQTSETQDGIFADPITLAIDTDANALATAQWLVGVGSLEQLSSPALSVDLLDEPSAAVQLAACQIAPTSVITLTNLQSTTPGQTVSYMVQGATWNVGIDDFDIAWYTTPVPPPVVTADGVAFGDGADSTIYATAY